MELEIPPGDFPGSAKHRKYRRDKSETQDGVSLSNAVKGLDTSLPPLTKISEIFEDLTARALALGLGSWTANPLRQPLRIATMCSGTESPLLALQMISKACAQRGQTLEFEHKFAAEIVPFKQAFIERNFHPPVIFRDVQQFEGHTKAETAYGSLQSLPAPGELDLLVAGFACVDFSNLNNRKQALSVDTDNLKAAGDECEFPQANDNVDFESSVSHVHQEGGKSSKTFRAVAVYARDHRPPLVLLENIKLAPWAQICRVFEHLGYATRHIVVDTKRYYLPHTRQRGYMLAIDTRGSGPANANQATHVLKEWADLMIRLERPASSPVEDFLLAEGDPRLAKALEEYVPQRNADCPRMEVDWTICRARHVRYRAAHGLGNQTPLTMWSSGRSSMPSYAHRRWGLAQPDRVKDTLDILKLKAALQDLDFEYKSSFPDLSQNVDRNLGSAPLGLTGCMTPSGMPYSSVRGRPLVGIEALALQGLPIDDLNLTRETQRQLQDLAGNAMTTTVVGTAIVALLATCGDIVSHCRETMQSRVRRSLLKPLSVLQPRQALHQSDGRCGTVSPSIQELRILAQQSAQLCPCEGSDDVSPEPIYICRLCQVATACATCKTTSRHAFVEMRSKTRTDPRVYRDFLLDALPRCVDLQTHTRSFVEVWKNCWLSLECTGNGTESLLDDDEWGTFLDSFELASRQTLFWQRSARQSLWSALYASSSMRIKFVISGSLVRWDVYLLPPRAHSVNSALRSFLRSPVARLRVHADARTLVDGVWQLRLPVLRRAVMNVSGTGSLMPSWRQSLGLAHAQQQESRVWSHLEITCAASAQEIAFPDIVGCYKLLPDCETANRALHVRSVLKPEANLDKLKPLFLFFDVQSVGQPSQDRMVFSSDPRRMTPGDQREIIAQIEGQHPDQEESGSLLALPSEEVTSLSTLCVRRGHWVDTSLNGGLNGTDVPLSALLGDIRDLAVDARVQTRCCHQMRLLTASVDARSLPLTCGLSPGQEVVIDEKNDHLYGNALRWLLQRQTAFSDDPDDWIPFLPVPTYATICQKCAPPHPRQMWKVRHVPKMVGVQSEGLSEPSHCLDVAGSRKFHEDATAAKVYEMLHRARPSPIVVQFCQSSTGPSRTFLCSVNIHPQTLAHRATSTLLSFVHCTAEVVCSTSWRLDAAFTATRSPSRKPFTMPSNASDLARRFKFGARVKRSGEVLQLRIEQARSLAWMVSRESLEMVPFTEEAVEEHLSTATGWRLEARALCQVAVRGGIMAEEVGYGKTVILLALIKDRMLDAHRDISRPSHGLLPISATCIVVPPSLIGQWEEEVHRFWPQCRLLILTGRNLAKLDLATIRAAEVVLTTSTLFASTQYVQQLASWSHTPVPGETRDRRAYSTWFVQVMQNAAKLHQTHDRNCSTFWQHECCLNSDADCRSSMEQLHQSYLGIGIGPECQEPVERSSDTGAPVLHGFRFHRKVIDEQSYLDGPTASSIQALKTNVTWIVSGTPLIRDFADVKQLAQYLGVGLGIDDNVHGHYAEQNIRETQKARTDTETFLAYQSRPTPQWHQQRDIIAQRFLNTVARRNRAEIPEIPCANVIDAVYLSGVHRVLQIELESYLASEDGKITIKESNKAKDCASVSRSAASLLRALPSIRAALLKTATTVSILPISSQDTRSFSDIIQRRQHALNQILGRLRQSLDTVMDCLRLSALCSRCHYDCPHSRFMMWTDNVRAHELGDAEATQMINDLLLAYGNAAEVRDSLGQSAGNQKGKSKGQRASGLSMHKARSEIEDLTRNGTELVTQVRAVRYLQAAQELLQHPALPLPDGPCVGHGTGKRIEAERIRLNRECGHVCCIECHHLAAQAEFCAVPHCRGRMLDINLITFRDLRLSDQGSMHMDAKIERLIQLLATKPPTDQALVFTQYSDLAEQTQRRLREHGIAAQIVRQTMLATTQMRKFRQAACDTTDWTRVLILDPLDSSAAGHNLTNVQLVIFLHPILAASHAATTAAYTQAVGRTRRYGQTGRVEVHHMVALGTIDVNMVEVTLEGRLVQHEDRFVLADTTDDAAGQHDWGSRRWAHLVGPRREGS